MNAEEKKALVRELFGDLFTKGNLAVADKIFAHDYVGHDPGHPPLRGPEGVKESISMYRNAFPDLTFVVEDLICEGDKVVARWKATGTHKGELMGIPSTGRRGETTGIDIIRFSGNKIVEDWSSWDTLGLLQMLGVFPAPGQAPS